MQKLRQMWIFFEHNKKRERTVENGMKDTREQLKGIALSSYSKLLSIIALLALQALVCSQSFAMTFIKLADMKIDSNITNKYEAYRGVVIGTTHAYITTRDNDRLLIFDIKSLYKQNSFIGNIYPATYLDLGFSATTIVKNGEYLYVGGEDIAVVKVASPSKPKLISRLGHSAYSSLKIIGSRLFAITASDTVDVFDITKARYPKFLGTFGGSGMKTDVAVSGNYLFAAEWMNNPGIRVYLQNKSGLFDEIGFFSLGALIPYHVEVINGSLIVLTENDEWVMNIISLSFEDPLNLKILDKIKINEIRTFGFLGDIGVTGADILDLSNPASLARIGDVAMDGYSGDGYPHDVSLNKKMAIIGGTGTATVGRLVGTP